MAERAGKWGGSSGGPKPTAGTRTPKLPGPSPEGKYNSRAKAQMRQGQATSTPGGLGQSGHSNFKDYGARATPAGNARAPRGFETKPIGAASTTSGNEAGYSESRPNQKKASFSAPDTGMPKARKAP